MSRALRSLLAAQLLVLLVGLATIAQTKLLSLRLDLPIPIKPPMREVAAAGQAAHRLPKAAATKPAAPPKPVVRHHTSKPTAAARPRTSPRAARVATGRAGNRPQGRMEQAVARIPGYTKGSATWVLLAHGGHWGTADWHHNVIYISPQVPANRMYDVVAHEWSHIKSVQVYSGDVNAATAAMTRFYGGSGLVGAERAADCMARQLGADWTHYTPCANGRWQRGAADLLAGRRLAG